MAGILTGIDESPILETQLTMPYTLTRGQAASVFITQLANKVIVGSRCNRCARTVVPAQDYCTTCGGETDGMIEAPSTGVVTALTRTSAGTVGLIHLDGVDGTLLHRLDETAGKLSVGDRVEARWADVPSGSITDLANFVATASTQIGSSTEAADDIAEGAVGVIEYKLELPYRHSYGVHYGRLFDHLKQGRILGSKCPQCAGVLVPPRAYCDVCYVRTEQLLDVKDTGRLQAFSVIHLEFIGQTRKPPYVYAEVVLDGSTTRLIHTVAGIDVTRAAEELWVGMPVKAVWKDPELRMGTLNDIDYFEPAPEGPQE